MSALPKEEQWFTYADYKEWELKEGERYEIIYGEAYAMLKMGSKGAVGLLEGLARDRPDDPCVAFHLQRVRQGVFGDTVVMTEK